MGKYYDYDPVYNNKFDRNSKYVQFYITMSHN